MRTLQQSMRGHPSVSLQKEVEQNDRIAGLESRTTVLENDVQSINARLDDTNINKSSGTINNLHSNHAVVTNVKAGTVSADTINAGEVNADSLDTTRIDTSTLTALTSVNAPAVNASSKVETVDLNVTGNATIANLNFESFTAEEINADTLKSQSIENDGMITTANLTATESVNANTVNATDVEAQEINAVDGSITNLESNTATIREIAGNDILSNRFITNKAFYQDIIHIISDTNFVVIEVPVFVGGIYRLSYQNPVTNEVYFNMVINNTYDNCYFSYYRGQDPLFLDQVAIKDMKLYIKTWVSGRLYYHCDSLDTTEPPSSYGEWPIDITALDYPLFTATRTRATVYTNYVNIGMEDQELGTAVLSYNTTNDWTLVERQRTDYNPAEYDPSTDTLVYTYIPNQNVNNDQDVTFNSVDSTTDIATENLTMKSIADNQYLIKRSGSTKMAEETPKDLDGNVNDDATTMNRTSKVLVDEAAIADWNGATNREYVPGTDGHTETYRSSDITQIPSATSLNGQYYYTDGTGTTLDELIESSTYCKPALLIEGAEHGGTKTKTVNPEGSLNAFSILRSRGYEVVGFPRLNGNTYNAMVYGAERNPDDSYDLSDINGGLSRGTQILLVTGNSSLDYVLVLTPGNYTGEEGLYGNISHAEIKLIDSISSITRVDPNEFTVNYTETTTTTNDYYTSSLDYKSNLPADATLVEMTTSSFEYEKTFAEVAPIYSSSIQKVGKIIEGEWAAGKIVAPELEIDNLQVNENATIDGNVSIGGDLTVAGKTITVHSEEITTEEDTIELRHDAQTGIVSGQVSGLIINNYNGNGNDSQIALDSSGTLRIGDIGDTEPVATRDETTNLTDAHILQWDATGNKIVDSGTSVSDVIAAGTSTVEGWDAITTLLGTPTDLADLIAKARTYMNANNFSEMRLAAYTTVAQAASYISLTWTSNVVFDLQVNATNGFKARFFDNNHFGIYVNNNWDVNIIEDVIVKDANGELTVTSDTLQSNTNLEVGATGNITMTPTNAFVIPTTAPTTLVNGAIWIS